MNKQYLENIEHYIVPQSEQEKKVTAVVLPIVLAHRFELVHIKVSRQKTSARVVLYVDELEIKSPVTLERLTFLNRLLGDALDVADAEQKLFHGSYELEVSSPGLDRPLSKKSHFQSVLKSQIHLKTDGLGMPKAVTGVLQEVGDLGVVLASTNRAEVFQIPWQHIRSANLIYDFSKNTLKKEEKGPLKRRE